MVEKINLLRLLQCNDSAFPSGAFAFSNGLESLILEQRVNGYDDVKTVIISQIIPRWLSFDRFYMHRSYSLSDDLDEVIYLDQNCHSHNTNAVLASASRRMGRALLKVHSGMGTPLIEAYRTHVSKQDDFEFLGYEPVVQGLIAKGLKLEIELSEAAVLNGVMMGFVSAAIRLGKLGAIKAQLLLSEVTPIASAGLDRLPPQLPSSFSPIADIATMRKSSIGANLFAT